MAHLDIQLTQASGRRRWRRLPTRPSWWLYLIVAAIALLMLIPVGYLILRAVGAGDDALAQLRRPANLRVLGASVLLAGVVTAASLLIGVPLAWLTTRSDLPGRRIWLIMAMAPLAIPSYIGAWAIISVLGPKGLLQRLLTPLGVERLPEIYGFAGAAFALTLFGFPYVLLSVRVALRRMDPALEEAARSLGRPPRQIFRSIVLPQLRPAIAAGGLLVALYTLSDFGAVSLLRYTTFTSAIRSRYSLGNLTGAAVLSLLLVILAALLLGAEALTRGRVRYHRSSVGAMRRAAPTPLGGWKYPALLFCTVVMLFSVVLPLVAIVGWLVVGLRAGQPLNFQPSHVLNSMLAAGIAAAAATVAAVPVVLLAVRYPGRLTTLLERCTYVGYALPGIVVALALVFLGANYLPGLYQTLSLLVVAYVVRFLPQAIGSVRTSFLQINPRIEEAARALGRPRWQVVTSIVLPLLAPGLTSGAALVFLSTLKELPATLLLGPTGFKTLATDIWNQTTELQFSQAALPALLLLVAAAGSLALTLAQDRRR
jgi:iron(III) transport system permease protein